MIFVDTGYFIALFDPGDQLFPRAAAWSRSVTQTLVTTEYVLIETVNYFSRPADRVRANAIIDAVADGRGFLTIPSSTDLFQAGCALHRQRSDKSWSLTDCISFHVMRERHIRQALAYDQHFEQAGLQALLRRDP